MKVSDYKQRNPQGWLNDLTTEITRRFREDEYLGDAREDIIRFNLEELLDYGAVIDDESNEDEIIERLRDILTERTVALWYDLVECVSETSGEWFYDIPDRQRLKLFLNGKAPEFFLEMTGKQK